jgi:hypothetical protein
VSNALVVNQNHHTLPTSTDLLSLIFTANLYIYGRMDRSNCKRVSQFSPSFMIRYGSRPNPGSPFLARLPKVLGQQRRSIGPAFAEHTNEFFAAIAGEEISRAQVPLAPDGLFGLDRVR